MYFILFFHFARPLAHKNAIMLLLNATMNTCYPHSVFHCGLIFRLQDSSKMYCL